MQKLGFDLIRNVKASILRSTKHDRLQSVN
jgi:hypothetical protein